MDFPRLMFESAIPKVTKLKFLLSNYKVHWQQHFEGHRTVEDFINMDQVRINSFIKTLVNIMK